MERGAIALTVMRATSGRYFWAIAAIGINPLTQIGIALLVTHKFGLAGFGEYAVLAAVYSTLCVIGRLTNWQHVLMDLQTSQSHSTKNMWLSHTRMDLIWASSAGLTFLMLNWIMGDPIGNSWTALSFALAGLVYNSGIITGILRFHEKHKWIAMAGIISLTAKISWIHCSGGTPTDTALQVSTIDLITWCGLMVGSNIILSTHREGMEEDVSSNGFTSFRDKISLYISSLLALPTQHLDKVMLANMLTPTALGTYALVQRLTALFSLLSESLGSVLFKRLHAQSDSLLSGREQRRMFLIGCALFAPPLVLMLMALPLLDEWLFAGHLSGQYLSVGLFYTAFALASGLFWVHLLAVIKLDSRAFLATTIVSILSYLALLIPLTKWLSMSGALIALTSQYAIVIVSRLWLLRKY